jgi:hypothetical protein
MRTLRKALYGCAAAAAGTTIWVAGAHASTSHPGAGGQHARVKQVTVTGHLEFVGGPAPGTPRPQAGTVSWSGRAQGKVHVGADGAFALHLQPGRYKLTGRPADAAYVCQASKPLHVRAGRPVQMDVFCQMR